MSPAGRPRSFDRTEALRRAMRLFWERGYEGVSLAELTDDLGINKPSLYAAFRSKEALFREAIALYTESEGSATSLALEQEPTARAAIETMLRNNARAYSLPGRPRGCMVVLAASVGSSENAEVRAFLTGIRREARELLVRRIERGVCDGDVPDGADAQRIATFFNTVLTGLSVQARDGASHHTMNRVIDDAMALWDLITLPVPASPRQ